MVTEIERSEARLKFFYDLRDKRLAKIKRMKKQGKDTAVEESYVGFLDDVILVLIEASSLVKCEKEIDLCEVCISCGLASPGTCARCELKC